ncbi:MAG: nuclear transport factor 2 family protein [Melioribacteraceae bacterium]|nr:nuclear transport factor 2 family protein [Melioribacteraceae bacterium]
MTILINSGQWSDKQQEIWQNVVTYTDLIMKGDVEGFLEHIHKDFSGWNYYDTLPANKDDLKMELLELPKRKVNSYNLIPMTINIFNDFAIVHYYYSMEYLGKKGEKVNKRGRNTDILMRHKMKWVLIGDHVGILRKK